MLFGKSIAMNDSDLAAAASAARASTEFGQAESEFIERLRQGDADAFDTLVSRHSTDVFSFLVRITGDADEAGDLAQETFLSAIKAVNNFRGESAIKTWLFRIAINHARNRHRWWKRRGLGRSISTDEPIGDSNETAGDHIAGDGPSPEQMLLNRERERAVLKELAGLAEPFKEVLVLCDIEDLSYEEIATALDLNIGTVKSRIARGREQLRKRLKGL